MRPLKYLNLGNMSKLNCPLKLHSKLERLLTELDKIAVYVDPCDVLSELSEVVGNKLDYIEEQR